MGKRGPAPTPSAILRARGSWRANANKREPHPPPGRPICPAWLPKEAKKAWRALAPILDQMRVLTVADRDALTRYCVTWSMWRKSVMFIQENGETYRTPGGEIKTYPQVGIVDRLASQLGKLEQSFGLTPSARSRVETVVTASGEKKDEGDKIQFFTGSGA